MAPQTSAAIAIANSSPILVFGCNFHRQRGAGIYPGHVMVFVRASSYIDVVRFQAGEPREREAAASALVVGGMGRMGDRRCRDGSRHLGDRQRTHEATQQTCEHHDASKYSRNWHSTREAFNRRLRSGQALLRPRGEPLLRMLVLIWPSDREESNCPTPHPRLSR